MHPCWQMQWGGVLWRTSYLLHCSIMAPPNHLSNKSCAPVSMPALTLAADAHRRRSVHPQVSPGRFVGYEAHPSDAASLGQPISAFPTLRAAITACRPDPRCIGMKYVHDTASANKFQTFQGTLWEGVTGKVRVTGESIDPWVVTPTST